MSTFSKVDLPDPFGPAKATRSGPRNSKLRPPQDRCAGIIPGHQILHGEHRPARRQT